MPYFRFHKFSFCDDYNNAKLIPSYANDGLNGLSSLSIVDHSKMQAKLEVGKRQDVIEMKQELGKARENLAEVKAIQLCISQQRPAITSMLLLCFF